MRDPIYEKQVNSAAGARGNGQQMLATEQADADAAVIGS